jgi:hypothetical protein
MMTREGMIASLKKARSYIHPRRNIAEAAACPCLDEVIAALEAETPCACGGREPFTKLDHIDLIYSPEDERHWLKVGVLFGRGFERLKGQDIKDCTIVILPAEEEGASE